MAKVLPPSRSTAAHTRVENAPSILKRFYVAERQLMRTLAAWFVGTSQWDLKRQLSQDMWQTAQHADALRTRVLELRYGLGGEHPRTLDEVGRTFNVTRERIRQIENQSLKKLQSLNEAQKLREAT